MIVPRNTPHCFSANGIPRIPAPIIEERRVKIEPLMQPGVRGEKVLVVQLLLESSLA